MLATTWLGTRVGKAGRCTYLLRLVRSTVIRGSAEDFLGTTTIGWHHVKDSPTGTFSITPFETMVVLRPKPQKVLRSEVTLPLSVNKTIGSRLDRGKHFESNCACWQSQTAADCEKETISCRSSLTVCTHSNNIVTGDRVGTPYAWGRHPAKSPAKADLVTTYSQISPSLQDW